MIDRHFCKFHNATVTWSKESCLMPRCRVTVEGFDVTDSSALADIHIIILGEDDPIVIRDIHPESPKLKGDTLILESRVGNKCYTVPGPILYWWTQ